MSNEKSSITEKKSPSDELRTDVVKILAEGNQDRSLKEYSIIAAKLKNTKSITERINYLQDKLHEYRDATISQKPLVVMLFPDYPDGGQKVYEMVVMPFVTLCEYLEGKLKLLESKRETSKVEKSVNIDEKGEKAIIKNKKDDAPVVAPQDRLLKRKEVAKIFSVSLPTISKWDEKGKLKSYRMNTRVFFKESEVLEELQARNAKKKK